MRRRSGSWRKRPREVPRVAGRVGHVEADQVGAGWRGAPSDAPVPGRLLTVPRGQEALHESRSAGQVRAVDLHGAAAMLIPAVADRDRGTALGDQ